MTTHGRLALKHVAAAVGEVLAVGFVRTAEGDGRCIEVALPFALLVATWLSVTAGCEVTGVEIAPSFGVDVA